MIVKKERNMKAIARNILLHHLRTDYVSRAGRPRTLAVEVLGAKAGDPITRDCLKSINSFVVVGVDSDYLGVNNFQKVR